MGLGGGTGAGGKGSGCGAGKGFLPYLVNCRLALSIRL